MNPHPDNEGGAAVSAPSEIEETLGAGATVDAPEEDFAPVSSGILPASAFDALKRQYEEADRERSKTMLLLPGRWKGALAVRFHPIPFDETRRKARKMVKGGETTQSELNFVAGIIAEATTEILMRPAPGEELESMASLLGREEPVRFDATLAEAVGVKADVEGLTEAAIARLVFKNPEAMTAFYAELAQWLREESAEDEDDAERPT